MASENEHLECANRTHKTIEHLLADKNAHSPWVAIAAFYKALHIVEAVFANDRSVRNTSNHDEREHALKSARKYQHIYEHYSPLKRASLNARYLSEVSQFDCYLSPDDVVAKLLKHHLHQLEKSAGKFLTNAALLNSVASLNATKP